MSSQRTPIRFGLPAAEAARRWEADAETLVQAAEATSLEKADELTWTWQVGDLETGRLEFFDRGSDRGEAQVEVNRRDGAAGERASVVVDRLIDLLTEPGLDPPVVARDPHQGEPPEASTDADQPL